MLKSGAKDQFFKSLCVHLGHNSNLKQIKDKYSTYLTEDPTMADSREDNFLKKVIDAFEQNQPQDYEDAELQYKKYTDLDKWKTIVFSSIKTRITSGGEDVEGGYL